MGATCCKIDSSEQAPPPYEAPGYKQSDYESSHYGPSHYQPSHYAPPSYTPQRFVKQADSVTTTRHNSNQRKIETTVQRRATSPIQQKFTNSSRQKAANFTQPKIEKKAVTQDRDGVQNELMILGLHKADGYTPHVLAKLVASALGTSIAHGDIIDVYRIPGNGRKTQPLVIKFSSTELRDKWVELKKKKKGLLAHQVHPVFGDGKVTVVERLTPENQALFERVQRFSRQNNYQFVWARHGDIFIRKTAGAKGHLIQCDDDLKNLCN